MAKLKKVFGTKGNDTLTGGNANEFLNGKAGNDDVRGGNGNDVVFGGPGNDVVGGGAGNDIVFGGSGNDTVNGGNGNDLLIGGGGDDRIVGSAGTDILLGRGGADIFRIDSIDSKLDYIVDFKYNQGDRIDIAPEYDFSKAVISDNGFKVFGVTVTFYDDNGVAGPKMVILGVDKASDVHDDWFI